jgi:hypothetical protein
VNLYHPSLSNSLGEVIDGSDDRLIQGRKMTDAATES